MLCPSTTPPARPTHGKGQCNAPRRLPVLRNGVELNIHLVEQWGEDTRKARLLAPPEAPAREHELLELTGGANVHAPGVVGVSILLPLAAHGFGIGDDVVLWAPHHSKNPLGQRDPRL